MKHAAGRHAAEPERIRLPGVGMALALATVGAVGPLGVLGVRLVQETAIPTPPAPVAAPDEPLSAP